MPDEQTHRLVDQLHRVEIGGRHRLGALRRHLRGKLPGGGIVRKDHISIGLEELGIELIDIAGGLCDKHMTIIT